MNEHLTDIVDRLAAQITEQEGRERKRNAEAQAHFLHGIEHLIIQLWKGTKIHEGFEGGVNKRAGWYSENSRYRDPNLTFKQTVAAYDGLIKLGLVEETQGGYLNRETLEGTITRFAANDELLSILSDINEDPFKAIQPDLYSESIILRDKIDGKKQQIDYLDTPGVNEMRDNLLLINKCLKAHYPDIRIRDDEWLPLQERIMADPKKQPIDLTRRTLVRVFSEGRFDRGGRFYRGWWQNVPSEYRPYITIAGKKTCEYDFSQLNPHMVYFLRDKELGSEDAYNRVFDCDHRDLVKEAFNAMMQSSTLLLKEPEDIDKIGCQVYALLVITEGYKKRFLDWQDVLRKHFEMKALERDMDPEFLLKEQRKTMLELIEETEWGDQKTKLQATRLAQLRNHDEYEAMSSFVTRKRVQDRT